MIFAAGAGAQIVLDPSPARVLGHQFTTPVEQLLVTNINPNFSVSGGLYSPTGVAVDTSGSTPVLYVADTGNNRILGWNKATSTTLTNEKAPDVIIGQPNGYTTLPSINGGLRDPSGLLVDPKGNLYVVDSGNNRVLRYPAPVASGATPDIVLGQPDPYTSVKGNQGASTPTAKTVCLNTLPGTAPCPRGYGLYLSSLAMDSSGNLFVVDAGNSRVLRYPAAELVSGATSESAPSDLVVGQAGFTVVNPPTGVTDKSTLYVPAGVAFDSAGHLFVTDAYSRVLVFPPQVSSSSGGNGIAAIRFAGIVSPPPATATSSTLYNPNGIVMMADGPAVLDSGDNRLLIFDAFSSKDWATTDPNLVNPPPVALAVLGQGANLSYFTGTTANAGNPQASFNNSGTQVATFNNPVAAAVAGNGDLFVADAGNNRVLVYANNGESGTAVAVLGQNGFAYSSPNSLHGEEFYFGSGSSGDAGIAVDSSTSTPHLYVSDPNNDRVLGFADARKVGPGVPADIVIGEPDLMTALCNFGGKPNVAGTETLARQPTNASLCYPTGLAVDPASGDLYVADSSNGRVLRFPAPFAPANSSQQANLVLGQSGFTGISNPQASQSVMVFPYGLYFDPVRGLFVSDEAANRVLLFPISANTANGEQASTVIGQPNFTSTSNSVLNSPHHIAEDTIAELYVADSGHGQIQIFNVPAGGGATDTPINAITGLYYPEAVWVNQNTVAGYQNDIWVGDGSVGLSRFPVPNPLVTGNTPSLIMPAAEVAGPSVTCSGPLCAYPAIAITQDGSGNLYVADTTNRVGVHYAALSATNGASFVCAMGCTLGGLLEQSYYLAPAAYGSLFTFNSLSFPVTATTNYVLPVPTTLGGIEVLVGCATGTTCPPPPPSGQPACVAAITGFACAPLAYVAPNQINFVVPNEAPTSGTAHLEVINPATSQVLGSGSLIMNSAAPGFFIESCATPCSNPSGQTPSPGQIAALNCNLTPCENTVNGTAHPANPGSTIQLFLTGQGLVPGGPADGETNCTAALSTGPMPEVIIGTTVAKVSYSGLAPCYVGLWQINAIVPTNPGQPNTAGWPTNVFPVLVKYNGPVTDPPGDISNPSLATTIVINAPQ